MKQVWRFEAPRTVEADTGRAEKSFQSYAVSESFCSERCCWVSPDPQTEKLGQDGQRRQGYDIRATTARVMCCIRRVRSRAGQVAWRRLSVALERTG